MPPVATQSSPTVASTPEGTSLWNVQTQSPEWVPLNDVQGKISSGSYRTYAGSDVTYTQGIGEEVSAPPQEASTAITGGAIPTHTEAKRGAVAREAAHTASFDSAGERALAVADGVVSGLSGGFVEGLSGSDYMNLVRAKRDEAHGNYKTLGELAAIAGSVLAPEAAAVKYSPLGLVNDIFGAASKATETALAVKVGSNVLRRGISDAVGGAVASGALSSAHAIEGAIEGKPVSGYAIVDDVGLGAVIGFGVGAVAEGLSGSAKRAKDIKSQIQAAARFDESAVPIRGTLSDVATAWNSAHNIASARVDALDDLAKAGMLDADVPGSEWTKVRVEARNAADAARADLVKLAGTDDPVQIGARLHDMAVSGKAKDAQKLYEAFDTYGTKVSALDDAMQPTTYDTAHLHDVIGDIDLSIPASEHPFQRIEQMINNGVPHEEIEKFAQELDSHYNKADKTEVGPGSGLARDAHGEATTAEPGDKTGGGKVRPLEPQEATVPGRVTKVIDPDRVIESRPGEGITEVIGSRRMGRRGQIEIPTGPGTLGTDINAPVSEDLARSTLLGGSRGNNEVPGFQAKKILEQARAERATGVMSPMRPTDLGRNIQSLMDKLTSDTGGRLGSAEARKLANDLGMNTSALQGPVSQRLGDLWALHRLSEGLASAMTRGVKGVTGSTLQKAAAWGVTSSLGSAAYQLEGPFAAGAVRSLARHAIGTALYGAASVTAVAGRFRQAAVNGLAKALNPTTRQFINTAGIFKTVSASYEPSAPPTTDYQTKADQLRRIQQNPEPVKKHIQEAFKGIGAVNPAAYTAAVDAAMSRLTNLAKALPKNSQLSILSKTRGPTEAQLQDFHKYEAVTADRELVFKYLKAGFMPQGVIDGMNEQHPDFLSEIREYVLNNTDELQSAPYNTKVALSKLLGVPMVPGAMPEYVQRMQEPYIKAKQDAAQKAQAQQGPSSLHATPPTTVQIIQLPH